MRAFGAGPPVEGLGQAGEGGMGGRCWGESRVGSGNFLGTTERETGRHRDKPREDRGTERGSKRGTEG